MKRYRILQKGKRFYVQYKCFWWWDGDDASNPNDGYATMEEAKSFYDRCRRSDLARMLHAAEPEKVVLIEP